MVARGVKRAVGKDAVIGKECTRYASPETDSAHRLHDFPLLDRVGRLTAGECCHRYRVVWTTSECRSGDDGVFASDVRLPLVEPARKIFQVVEAAELRVLGESVLHAQAPNLT